MLFEIYQTSISSDVPFQVKISTLAHYGQWPLAHNGKVSKSFTHFVYTIERFLRIPIRKTKGMASMLVNITKQVVQNSSVKEHQQDVT